MFEVGEQGAQEPGALGAAVLRLEQALTRLEEKVAQQADEQPDMFAPLRQAVAHEAVRAEADQERAAWTAAREEFEAERARWTYERAAMAAELDAARGREKALEEAGGQASAALGRAIDEIRAALGEEPGSDDAEDPAAAEQEAAAWPS